MSYIIENKQIQVFDDFASFPASGAEDLLYFDKSTGKLYSWTGASYEFIQAEDPNATLRANHIGTQLAATISDFAASVRNTILTGLTLATSTAVTAADSILVAIGKLQAQVTINNSKVTNATHTGEVTGSTALTIDKTSITNKTTETPVAGDFLLFSDTSDSGNLKKVNASNFIGSTTTITTAAISSNQDNFNIVGLVANAFVRINATSNVDLTGINTSTLQNGDRFYIAAVGGGDIKLKNNNNNSLAANRFLLDSDFTIMKEQGATLVFDGISQRLRVLTNSN